MPCDFEVSSRTTHINPISFAFFHVSSVMITYCHRHEHIQNIFHWYNCIDRWIVHWMDNENILRILSKDTKDVSDSISLPFSHSWPTKPSGQWHEFVDESHVPPLAQIIWSHNVWTLVEIRSQRRPVNPFGQRHDWSSGHAQMPPFWQGQKKSFPMGCESSRATEDSFLLNYCQHSILDLWLVVANIVFVSFHLDTNKCKMKSCRDKFHQNDLHQ